MYIDRDLAIGKTEAFCDVFVTKWTDKKVIAWIKNLPTAADVAPVVHGYWTVLDECANAGAYCSVCHKKVYKECYGNCKMKSKFCPNCGAKMDGGTHETD